MPWASSDENSAFIIPHAIGPVMLAVPVLATQPTDATIAASGNWTSGLLSGDGYKVIAIGCKSTQAGQISIQRYLDAAGICPQGAAMTQALVANTAAVLNVTDGLPFGSFTITISNSGASAATISNFAAILAAA